MKTIGNKTLENITLNKDINSILKHFSDNNINNDNLQKSQEINNANSNKSEQSIVNANNNNLNQQFINKSKDFSHLFILMRKATKLFSSFDNRVKIFTDKIFTEKL